MAKHIRFKFRTEACFLKIYSLQETKQKLIPEADNNLFVEFYDNLQQEHLELCVRIQI